MQLRLLDRATQEPDAWRHHVGIVRPIRPAGYAETVVWIDGERNRLAGCRAATLRQTRRAAAAPQPFGYLALARLTKSLV
jgi:hypothetical protein